MKQTIPQHLYRAAFLLCIIFYASTECYAVSVAYGGMEYMIYEDVNEKEAELTKGKGGKVTIPDKIPYKGSYVTVKSIAFSAFEECRNLVSVDIPKSVTRIGGGAFRGCSSLVSVDIPNSVTSIGNNAFEGCSSLESVNIPNSVTIIGEKAFAKCSLLTLVPSLGSVTRISRSAFSNCISLTSLTIPGSVTEIGASAFYNCAGLASVTCLATTPPNADIYTFDDETLKYTQLYVSEECVSAYSSVSPWCKFLNRGTTGINDVSADGGVRVWNDHGTIRIEGAEGPCTVYDMQGKLVGRMSRNAVGGLGKGAYIVKMGKRTFKVAI